ncbi:MAG TPA: hypothetical protein VKD72_23720, partial [Gemmataceae bacterium]|nr:hypothetical protein [Gemmataceae bacterium]
NHALARLKPGDTLSLRGGTYHEHATVTLSGTADRPITLRSYPGELAILDGGFREFLESPKTAWEPAPDGAKGEFRSTKGYPDVGKGRRSVAVLGNFADSMVPLHGYRFLIDFRSDNPYWNLDNKLDTKRGVWCGPGLWFNPESQRIHVRLRPAALKAFGEANYRGETDPRKLPLVVAASVVPLRIARAKHVRVQDLVVRGSASHTVEVDGAEDVILDNVTVYGGAPALHARASSGLKLTRCALRGLSAPWSSRSSHKYRGNSPYLLIVAGDSPQCRDFEFAGCEFTDNHDGLIVGTLKGLKFHHNLVENFDDDGIYLTLKRSAPPEGIHVYQNILSRCLTTFAFAESGRGVKNDVGPGVYIYRNLLDLRRGTLDSPPNSAEADAKTSLANWCRDGRPAGDHGSPVWEPLFVYHNTILCSAPAFRDYYAAGLGGHTQGTRRCLFNNIVVQVRGNPGLVFPPAEVDLQADGNLLWGIQDGPKLKGDFFAAFRRSKLFEASKKSYPPGWGTNDRFADPQLVRLPADGREPVDVRLRPGSPAVDAGVALPAEWPDPLRKLDRGKPDVGALPLGADPLRVGPSALPRPARGR